MLQIVSVDSLMNLVYVGFMFLFFFYGQRIQVRIMLINVRRSLGRLLIFRNAARGRLLERLLHYRSDRGEVEKRADRLIDSFAIPPVSLDPSGIVGKLEHVLNTYDDYLKAEVRSLATGGTAVEVKNLTNLLEVSIGLDAMFRVVRHYYLLAQKPGGMLALAQLQMALPMIMDEAEAYRSAIDAFTEGKPVGDGFGVLVAMQLASGSESRELVEDTVVYEVPWQERRLLVVRAKGPGGSVGKPGLAVEKLIEEAGPVALIVTADAALKLEGEKSAEVVEGVGAAIGGPGTDRYRIEEAAVKHSVPLFAVVVKMSSKEAISTMASPIRDAVAEASRRVQNAILDRTKPGETAIVAGIGNTIGIP